MFDNLSDRLGKIFDGLRGRGALAGKDVDEALREVRRALLEADVSLEVVRAFVEQVRGRAVGAEVTRSVTPGQQVIYTLDVTQPRTVVFDSLADTNFTWSLTGPRGNLVAFTRIGGGAFRIGVMSPSGNGEKLLTNSWQDEAPTWSPNGRVIQFFRTVQGSGKTSVMQVDVTGAKERKIDTPVDGSDPAWGPILP